MCIFCSIANHEIGSYTVYEDESVLAFLDIAPTAYGHTLVIPKKHYSSFLDCDTETLHHCFEVAQSLANQLETKLGCAGINVLTNVHPAAGQSVEHFHIHLIPRYDEKDALTLEFGHVDVDLENLQKKMTTDQ